MLGPYTKNTHVLPRARLDNYIACPPVLQNYLHEDGEGQYAAYTP